VRDILAWVIAVEALGLAALPLLRAFFQNRRDAALLSRPVGLAIVSYLAWAATLLPRVPFERRLLLLALVAVGLVSWRLDRKTRPRRPDSRFWGPDETRAAVWFWGATLVFLVIRAAAPEILGAEKFMDLAFFNSIARHGAMPPLDPWMAGKTINYYYWGYLLAASLAKLASVTPFVSYNLSIATFAGFSFAAAACLGARLSEGSRRTALGSGFAVVFAGNVQGALDALRAPFDRGFDYWHASRVIAKGDTINEFPFFTFFHADLHPHLLAFPFYVAAFACAHRLFEQEPFRGDGPGPPRWRSALPFLFAAFVAGTAVAANTWNLPSIAIGLVGATALRERPLRPMGVLRNTLPGVGCVVGALLLFRPYTRTYSLPYNGLGWTTQRSGLLEFLGVWGFFFAVAIAALWPGRPDEEASRRRADLLLAASAGAALLLSMATRRPALLPLLFLALLALARGIAAVRAPRSAASDDTVFSAFLLLLALSMIAGCEFVYFKDSYGDQLQRMNTIFKFYLQAWPLFGVAAAVFAAKAWSSAAASSRVRVLQSLTAAAVVGALLYPANAAASRLRQREGAFSLDALPPFARRSAGDAAAVVWLEQNAPGRAVVLEATGDPYRDFARISSHTGLPTVLGWANHEGLWRGNDPEVNVRAQLVRGFYSTADEETALEIVKKFGVQYVVLGDLERASHPNAQHVSEFLFLKPVVSGQTIVYRVGGGP
jgi:YYY domain-containing protein